MKISFVSETKPRVGKRETGKGWNGFVWSSLKKKEKKWISELVGVGDGFRRELSSSCASPEPRPVQYGSHLSHMAVEHFETWLV